MFWGKKRSILDDFETDFDMGFDTSDDNSIREFGSVVDQHISDALTTKRVIINAQLWAIIQLVNIRD